MVFIDWRVSIRRLQVHAQPIRLFAAMLVFVAAADVLFRQALQAVPVTELTVLSFTQVLTHQYGLAAVGLLCVALALWIRMLKQHQLSFFYPLWGMLPLVMIATHVAFFQYHGNLTALFGACLIVLGIAIVMRGGHSV